MDTKTRELQFRQETGFRGKENELRDEQIGWIDLSKGEGKGRQGLINVRDRFGDRLWLPCNVAEEKMADLDDKLTKLGYQTSSENWIKMELDERTKEQLFNASAFLPPILAVQAVMNSEPDEYYFPKGIVIENLPAPLVGLEGKPHSGKTLGMIIFMAVNGEVVNGFDFDPFSGQSLNHCLESIKEKLKENEIDPKESISKIVPIVDAVYKEEKSDKVLEAKANINLRWLLESAVEAQLNKVNPEKMLASLVDLPGEDERTEKWDVMHLARHLIPTIDMTRKDERDITEVPILDFMNSHIMLLINDKIRSELGGYARWHRPAEEHKAWYKAMKVQRDFIEALR